MTQGRSWAAPGQLGARRDEARPPAAARRLGEVPDRGRPAALAGRRARPDALLRLGELQGRPPAHPLPRLVPRPRVTINKTRLGARRSALSGQKGPESLAASVGGTRRPS